MFLSLPFSVFQMNRCVFFALLNFVIFKRKKFSGHTKVKWKDSGTPGNYKATVECAWYCSPQAALHEKPGSCHDEYSHRGLGILWKTVGKLMPLGRLFSRSEWMIQQDIAARPNDLLSSSYPARIVKYSLDYFIEVCGTTADIRKDRRPSKKKKIHGCNSD